MINDERFTSKTNKLSEVKTNKLVNNRIKIIKSESNFLLLVLFNLTNNSD